MFTTLVQTALLLTPNQYGSYHHDPVGPRASAPVFCSALIYDIGQCSHTHNMCATDPPHGLSLGRSSIHRLSAVLTDCQATNTPALSLPSWLTVPNLPANLGTMTALVYSIFYILMEPVAGSMLAPLLLGATAYSNHLTSTYGSKANYYAIGVHVVAWIAQFIGHGVFEGRAPALLDNLVQAIFLAPFFVWLEILFFFGYRPELKARLDKSVQTELTKLKSQKASNNNAVKVNGSNGHAK